MGDDDDDEPSVALRDAGRPTTYAMISFAGKLGKTYQFRPPAWLDSQETWSTADVRKVRAGPRAAAALLRTRLA
jgi:hypothetical protein